MEERCIAVESWDIIPGLLLAGGIGGSPVVFKAVNPVGFDFVLAVSHFSPGLISLTGASDASGRGKGNFLWGLGDFTATGSPRETKTCSGSCFTGVVGRTSSKILTRELVGKMGVSPVALTSPETSRLSSIAIGPIVWLFFNPAKLSPKRLGLVLAFPTLPAGGKISRTSMSLRCDNGEESVFDFGLMGLCLAAANFAAILEGEEERFKNPSKVLELFDLVDSCTEEGLGR